TVSGESVKKVPLMRPDLPSYLTERLQQPLPGWRSQARYQPEMSYGRYFGPPPGYARSAAVLVLLYPIADEWHLPLTLRPAHMLEPASTVSQVHHARGMKFSAPGFLWQDRHIWGATSLILSELVAVIGET